MNERENGTMYRQITQEEAKKMMDGQDVIINAATGKLKELPLFGQIPIISDLLDNIYYNK